MWFGFSLSMKLTNDEFERVGSTGSLGEAIPAFRLAGSTTVSIEHASLDVRLSDWEFGHGASS